MQSASDERDPIDDGESFASLFEAQGKGAPVPRVRRFSVGDRVEAVLVHLGKDGAVAQLDGKQQGNLSLTDLTDKDGQLRVSLGDRVQARVASLDARTGAITLVVDDEARRARELAPGKVVACSVTRIENYGVFVQITGVEGKAGRGLIPAAELGVPRGTDLRKKFPEGTALEARILESADGRLRLSMRGAKEEEERQQAVDYKKKTEKAQAEKPKASLGTFADLLGGKTLTPAAKPKGKGKG